MTAPTTRLSYSDAYDAWDRAKEDPKGIRVQFPHRAGAETFRSRLHYSRQIDRRDNCSIYEEGDALYGRSVYDTMAVRIKEDTEGKWWVYIEHVTLGDKIVESLSEIEGYAEEVTTIEHKPQQLLSYESESEPAKPNDIDRRF